MISSKKLPDIASWQVRTLIDPGPDQFKLCRTERIPALWRHSLPGIDTADQPVKVAFPGITRNKQGFAGIAALANARTGIKPQGTLLLIRAVAHVAVPGKDGFNITQKIDRNCCGGRIQPHTQQ